ncbi:hypothetical protein V2J09_013921 [Rumex salicifolius]
MAENKQISVDNDLNAKWDACLDLSLRRVVYTSVAGAFGGLLLFRSPVTRWASVALGAGVGIGSAYSDCSKLFSGRAPRAACRHSKFVKPSVDLHPPEPEISNASVSEDTTEA